MPQRRASIVPPSNGGEPTRARILQAAEHLFAVRGFEGSSVRQIADAASVNVAAINYHFETKQGLFEQVFARRVVPVNEERLRLLREVLASSPPVDLARVIDAFVRPPIALGNGGDDEARLAQMRFLSRALSLPEESAVMRTYYGRVRGEFIAALRRALPALPDDVLVWRYNLMVGALVYAMAGNERATEVTAGHGGTEARPLDVDQMILRVGGFCAAGFGAPLPGH